MIHATPALTCCLSMTTATLMQQVNWHQKQIIYRTDRYIIIALRITTVLNTLS